MYLWAMRNGAAILFGLSAILFLIGFGQALLSFQNTVGEASIAGVSMGAATMQWLMLLSGALTALSAAVLPFIGALAIYRWDHSARRSDSSTKQQ